MKRFFSKFLSLLTIVMVGGGLFSTVAFAETDPSPHIEDEKTKVEISVKDSNGNALIGAHIQVIYDGDGTVVEEWTSTDQPHIIENLKTGANFTLHVTAVPDGYVLPEKDISFELTMDGKIDGTGGTALAITLEAAPADSGHPVQFWTTAPTTFEITYKDDDGKQIFFRQYTIGKIGSCQDSGFKSGVEYTITFLKVPAGAIKPEPFTFTLTDTGVLEAEPIKGLVQIFPASNLIYFILQDPDAGTGSDDNPLNSNDDPGNNDSTDPGNGKNDTGSGTSDTGDDSSLFPWITLAFISGACLIATITYGKKRKSF